MGNNPIAFNQDTMTLTQVKYCAETLRTVFNLIERGAEDAVIASYIRQSRDQMVTLWGKT